MEPSNQFWDALSTNITEMKNKEADAKELARGLGEAAFRKQQAQHAQNATRIGDQLVTPESYEMQLNAELDKQMKVQEFRGAMNYDALSFDIAQRTAAETERMIQLADTVAQKRSVSFFDNPIQALANEFTTPWDQQALEGSKQKLELLNKAKLEMDQRIMGTAAAADAMKQTLTAGTAATLKSALASRLAIEAEEANIEAIRTNAAGLEIAAKASQQVVQAYRTLQDANNTNEERNARMEMRRLNRMQIEQALENKAELAGERANVIKLARQGLALDIGDPAIVLNPSAPGYLTDEDILRGYREGDKTDFGKIVHQAYSNETMRRLGRHATHGLTPIESVEYRRAIKWTPQNEIQALVESNFSNTIRASAAGKTKAAEVNEAAQAAWNQTIKNQETVIPGDKTNPLALSTIQYKDIPKLMPGLSRVEGANLLATLATGEHANETIDPQRVFNHLGQAVAARQITPQQATVLMSSMYERILAQANDVSGVIKITGRSYENYNSVLDVPTISSKILKPLGQSIGLAAIPAAATGIGAPAAAGVFGAGVGIEQLGKIAGRTTLSLNKASPELTSAFNAYAISVNPMKPTQGVQ